MQISTQDYAEIIATLQAAESDGHDKRRFPRMAVRGRIVITPLADGKAGTSYTALTRDLSFLGVGIMQTIPATAGQSIIVYLPRRNKPVLCILCEVRHARPLAEGLLAVGCEFRALVEQSSSQSSPPRVSDAAPADRPKA